MNHVKQAKFFQNVFPLGVADQLQSNFATDLRGILKVVFHINASAEEEEEDEEQSKEKSSKPTSESSVEEGLEAHECFVEERDQIEETLPEDLPLVFPLPVEESPSHAGTEQAKEKSGRAIRVTSFSLRYI